MDDRWSPADYLGLLLPEVLVRPEDRDVLHLFLELGLLVLRRSLDVQLAMHLASLGLDHLLRGGVSLGLVEFIVAFNLDLRGRHSPGHSWVNCPLGQGVNDVVHLIIFMTGWVVLGVDFVFVIGAFLLEKVSEHGHQVGGGTRVRASVHSASLFELEEGLLDVGSFKNRQLPTPSFVMCLL